MTLPRLAVVLVLGGLTITPGSAGGQMLRGSNLRNLFDTARNLGALQASASRGIRSDLYAGFAATAPTEWLAAWSDPPIPLNPAGLIPPYDMTARDYLSSLGQVVFEHAAGCAQTPWETAYALWEVGSGLEWINANATRDCIDCIANAWRRLAPRFDDIASWFPATSELPGKVREMVSSAPRTPVNIAEYNQESAILAQTALSVITMALGPETGFFGCLNGSLVGVDPEGLPIPGARAKDFRFYEGPFDGVPLGQRHYADQFDPNTARMIHYELALEYPPPPRTIAFELDVIWYRPDGTVLADQRRTVTASAGTHDMYYWQGRGAGRPGSWTPGSYHVEARIAGRVVAKGDFEITAAAPAPASCPARPRGSVRLETTSPGNPVIQWFGDGPRGLSCGYLRNGGLTQWLMGEEGKRYFLFVMRNGVPVKEYRLDRSNARAPSGWSESGLGYPVTPDGNRRARSATSSWTGRIPR